MTALVLTFSAKAFDDTELCITCLVGGNTVVLSTGETNENVTVKFLKRHMAYVSFTSIFFALLNSSTQNTQFPKKPNTLHIIAYVAAVRTRAVKIWQTRAKHVK